MDIETVLHLLYVFLEPRTSSETRYVFIRLSSLSANLARGFSCLKRQIKLFSVR